jgi:release factor glutamine methyltransferase
MTVAQALAQARQAGLERLDAQRLLCHVLGQSRAWLLAHDTDMLAPDQAQQCMALITRRAAGEPMGYLLGQQEFFGLDLAVGPGVLVPRPDTETLVSWALDVLQAHAQHSPTPPQVLDLGTGSGAIALAIQHQCPLARVTAVDASAGAIEQARRNAQQLGLPITCLQGHWFSPVAGQRFDLIVSNPPYIAEGDPHLPALRHEPISALTAGPDGLDDIRHIAAHAAGHLPPGGWLLLEHGHDQAHAVTEILNTHHFVNVSTRFDLAGHGRCTGGQTRIG